MPTEFVSAMTKQTTNILLLALLRVKHPSINTPVRIVNNTEQVQTAPNMFLEPITLRWQPFPFTINLPPEGTSQVPTLDVIVMNVDQEVSSFARSISGSDEIAKADLYIVSFDNPNDILRRFENYDVQNVQYNVSQLSFEMRLHQTLERGYVKETFRPGSFPNLFG